MKFTYNGATKTHISNFKKIKPCQHYRAIIINNLQVNTETYAWGGSFYILCMKLAYNDATKTHILNFPKIQHGDNYR